MGYPLQRSGEGNVTPIFVGKNSELGVDRALFCAHIVKTLHDAIEELLKNQELQEFSLGSILSGCGQEYFEELESILHSYIESPIELISGTTKKQVLSWATSANVCLSDLVPVPMEDDKLTENAIKEAKSRGCWVRSIAPDGVVNAPDKATARLMLQFDALDEVCKPAEPMSQQEQAKLEQHRRRFRRRRREFDIAMDREPPF